VPAPPWFSELLQGQELSSEQLSRLFEHYQLLERWNRKMSLTSVKAGAEMVIRHYCESLFFGANIPGEAGAIPNAASLSIADIGSGAGFPGVPIAILRPAWKVSLVEANQRKAVFLRESTRSLDNVSVLAKRAEDLSERFEWVVSRAVDPKAVLALTPRLASNFGLMLGEDDFLELKKVPNIAWAEPIRLPWGDRRVCVYGRRST
jgi:16S rRNA (guanine527-N7)-methyltransferase